MTAEELGCEGYTAAEPIDPEELEDLLWSIPRIARDRKFHDADGFMCELAGSAACVALGHVEPENGWEDDPEHPDSWDGDPLCKATTFEAACTRCEGPVSDCDTQRDLVDPAEFWGLVQA